MSMHGMLRPWYHYIRLEGLWAGDSSGMSIPEVPRYDIWGCLVENRIVGEMYVKQH